MLKRKVPPRLWDFGLVYETNILNSIPRGREQRTGIEMVTGETPDISEWINFEFYNRFGTTTRRKLRLMEVGVDSRGGLVSLTKLEATYAIGYFLNPAK